MLGPAIAIASTLASPAAAAVLPADATAVLSGTPDLLSLLPTPVGNASVSSQAVNGDGTRVVFVSRSDGLVADDDDAVQNVYVKLLDRGGAVELVSRADGVNGEPSHGECGEAAISHDGSQVAFTCTVSLDSDDTNGLVDVYVRNLDTHRTTLISRAPGGVVGDNRSEDPAIAVSAGTTFVAFTSSATNLVPGKVGDGRTQVYRRTIGGSDAMTLVSNNGNLAGPAIDALHPSISNDGLQVAFDTSQTLDQADTSNAQDVYIRDFSGNQPVSRLVSVPQAQAGPGDIANDIAQNPVISGSGTTVAFDLAHFVPEGEIHNVFRRVLTPLSPPTLISAVNAIGTPGNGDSSVTGIDDSGTVVGFESSATDLDAGTPPGTVNGFVSRDGEVQLVGRADAAGPVAPAGSDRVSVSGDGKKVVMRVFEPGIVGDSDPRFDSVVLRDLESRANQTVSRPAGGGPFVNVGESAGGGSVSADGRFVVFASGATGLGVPLGESAVFVRDVLTGGVTLVSRADGAKGASLHGSAVGSWISADGRRVAFEHDADENSPRQIFVRDIPKGRTFLASGADGADGAPGDGSSFEPSLSDDGSRVAFRSSSANLADGDTDHLNDVYVRELDAGRTILASRATGAGAKVPNSQSVRPVISGDGRHVAFDTTAKLMDDDDNDLRDIYVRDVDAGTTRLVSIAEEATLGNGDSLAASISRDGNRVSFASVATNLGGPAGALFVRDVAAKTLTVASRADGPEGAVVFNTSGGMLSADGVSFAFSGAAAASIAPGAPGDGVQRVYERNLVSGVTRLISRRSGAGGAPSSRAAEVSGITADGGCVTFHSPGDLSPGGSPDFGAVFMRAVTANCGRPVADGGPGPGAGAKAAVLSGLRLKPARFHVGGRKGGTRVIFRLDKAASVTLRFDQLLAGHKKGKRCSTRTRRGRRCTVVRLAGRMSLAERGLHAGSNTVKFSGRIGKRALKPGRYRLTATPLRGNARTVQFVVVKAPKSQRANTATKQKRHR